jgi:hypothetical protein
VDNHLQSYKIRTKVQQSDTLPIFLWLLNLLVLRRKVAVLRRANPKPSPGLSGSRGVRCTGRSLTPQCSAAPVDHVMHDPALASPVGAESSVL